MEGYLIFICSLLFASAVARPSKEYRTDYEYSSKTNAFYKLHIESVRLFSAKETCKIEGGQLMVPASRADISQVHGMFKKFPDLGEFVWVGDDGEKHDSAEEQPIIDLSSNAAREGRTSWMDTAMNCDVLSRKGEILTTSCYGMHPFVCKVDAKNVPYDEQCGVYGLNYTYVATVGSCYKVPQAAYNWNAAYSECSAQGAHLAILNSEAEHLAMEVFLRTVKRVSTARTTYFFFAGIRADRPTDGSTRVFRTVFNETLDQAGYNVWSEGEPNNHLDSEYCGSIFLNGKYNDVDCNDSYAFICEKEIHT